MPGKRFTRGEARLAVLAAGLDLMTERGPSIGLDRVSFAEAIERSGVPRPSAYRAFSDGEFEPQQQFRDELAMEIIEHCNLSDVSSTLERIAPLFAEAERDDATSTDLTRILRETIRLAASIYPCDMDGDPYFHMYVTLVAASRRREGALTSALRKVEATAAETSVSFYQPLAQTFGLRLRPGWTWESFAAAIASLEGGIYLLHDVSPFQGLMERPTGPDGEMQHWTLLGTLIEGLVITAFEPNPRMVVSAMPSEWHTAAVAVSR